MPAPPPRARTRDRLLSAAASVMATHGSAHLTTREVASHAGVTEATLFKYFPSKRDLLLAAVREQLPTLETALLDLSGKATVRENLGHIATAALAFFRALVPVSSLVLSDAALLSQQREVLRGHRGPAGVYERVADYLRAEQQVGRVDPSADPLALAALLIGPCFQWAFLGELLGTPPLPFDDAEFITRILDVFPLQVLASDGRTWEER